MPLPTGSIPTPGPATASRNCTINYLPGWANEPELFVRVGRVPDEEIWEAHQDAKRILLDYVLKQTGVEMDLNVLTLGFARRATAYKRADLLFSDLERLEKLVPERFRSSMPARPIPRITPGKALIESIFAFKERLAGKIKMVYLSNYDMDIALKTGLRGGSLAQYPSTAPGGFRHQRHEGCP